ncbi:MAG: S-layer homology domain-containing protein [Acidimicrobiia bacterium]
MGSAVGSRWRWAAMVLAVALFVPAAGVSADPSRPGGTFIDDNANQHEPNIEAVAAAGITAGCDSTARLYCPSAPVSRAEMATFLIRALGESSAGAYQGIFSDVPAGQWYTATVERAASLGITSGYPDGTFRPDAPVSRAEMSALLLRALGEDTNLPASAGSFSDVPADAWFAPYVEQMRLLGYTQGCGGGAFCPFAQVRRDEMASFIARGFGLAPIQPAPPETALVVSITDGDTIRVLVNGVNEPVRLIGIDAPEQNECGSDQATARLSQLVANRTVTLVKDVSERDGFGRLLRHVWVGETFVDRTMVADGWAHAVRYPPDTTYAPLLEAAQSQAQAAGVGIWSASAGCVTQQPPSGCHAAYPTVCIPPAPPDLDCGDIPHRRFQVLPPDPHNFDGDGDGIGCES